MTTSTKPRYKNPSMQTVYDSCLALAADKTSEMYKPDGSQRTGANVRIAFWDGFNGTKKPVKVPPGTMLSAAYQAGKEFARRQRASRD